MQALVKWADGSFSIVKTELGLDMVQRDDLYVSHMLINR